MQNKLSATQDISHLFLSEDQKLEQLRSLISEAYQDNALYSPEQVRAQLKQTINNLKRAGVGRVSA